MKNILLLTDFTELSDYAKSLATKVAVGIKANLHVLSVVETSSEVLLNDDGDIISSMGADTDTLVKEQQVANEKMSALAFNLPPNANCMVMFGELLDVINKQIKKLNIDLVVMGTHGVTGLKEKFSGSITQQVILNNRVPVLSLKCDRGNLNFSDFLITGDFEEKSPMNLDVIKGLQSVFNSTLHLLCVNTERRFKSTAESLKSMRDFTDRNELVNVEYHIHNDKSVEAGIMNFSNNYDANHELDIDIIAVEKKNKGALEYWFTGCAAIDYVNHIYRPIVTYLTK